MSLLAVIFGYVQGSIPEDLYAVAFQTLAIVSIVVCHRPLVLPCCEPRNTLTSVYFARVSSCV